MKGRIESQTITRLTKRAAAEPGSVVASATTWAALDGRVDGVALGAIALKGKRDPVEAWSVTGAAVPA